MPTDLNAILKLTVPVIVRLGQRPVPVETLLGLGPGAIIELHRPADGELDLCINNQVIGKGQAVKLGENFGIRISSVGTPRERVQALA